MPVYLAVSRQLIEQLGGEEGDFKDFILALKSGPSWASGSMTVCDKALKAWNGWRERRLEFPPSIGYLSLFVIAVEEESPERGPLAYYYHLRKVLGEPAEVNRPYPRFDRMIELWDDLERWSRVDRNGDLGLFKYSFAGNHIHVGIPREQYLAAAVMSDLYRQCPHCGEVKPLDRDFGRRTMNGKRVPQSWCRSCRAVSWKKFTGNNHEDSSFENTRVNLVQRSLERALRLVPRLRFLPGQRSSVTLVARRYERMPRELSISLSDGMAYNIRRIHPCWYSDIRPDYLGNLLKFGGTGFSEDEDIEYRWRLRGRKIIVLKSGEQISGFIQNFGRLEIGQTYSVLCCDEASAEIEAALQIIGAKPKDIYSSNDGIPEGFVCYKGVVPTVVPGEEFTGELEVFNVAPIVEISFSSGVRLGNGVWLHGYPPEIRIHPPLENGVTIDETAVITDSSGSFSSAFAYSPGKHIVRFGRISKRYEIVEPDCNWKPWICHRVQNGNSEYVICGSSLWTVDELGELHAITGIFPTNRLLLGRRPGDIFIERDSGNQSKPLNISFEPVWSIPDDPIHCDKRVSAIELLEPKSVQVEGNLVRSKMVLRWIQAIMDASRKGLIVSGEGGREELWLSYKKLARRLWKSLKNGRK